MRTGSQRSLSFVPPPNKSRRHANRILEILRVDEAKIADLGQWIDRYDLRAGVAVALLLPRAANWSASAGDSFPDFAR